MNLELTLAANNKTRIRTNSRLFLSISLKHRDRMLPLKRGFKQRAANESDHAYKQETRKALHSTIAAFQSRIQKQIQESALEEMDSLSDDEASSVGRDSGSSAQLRGPKYSRRLLLSTDQPLNIKDINDVNKIYCAESDALEKAQRNTLSRMFQEGDIDLSVPDFGGKRLKEDFLVLYDKIRR